MLHSLHKQMWGGIIDIHMDIQRDIQITHYSLKEVMGKCSWNWNFFTTDEDGVVHMQVRVSAATDLITHARPLWCACWSANFCLVVRSPTCNSVGLDHVTCSAPSFMYEILWKFVPVKKQWVVRLLKIATENRKRIRGYLPCVCVQRNIPHRLAEQVDLVRVVYAC